jgi:two-component system cell cycle sensor histidine kinase/response regulator CckA
MTELRTPSGGRRPILHAAGLPMLLVDPDAGLIEDVNDAACRFFGLTREALVGQPLTPFSRASPECLLDAWSTAAAGVHTFGVEHVAAAGRVVPVTVCAAPVDIGGRHLVHAMISERRAGPEARAALAQLKEATTAVNRAIVRARSEAELWSEASRIVVEVGGVSAAWVALADPVTRAVSVAAAAGEAELPDGRIDDLAAGDRAPVAEAIATGRALAHDDIATGLSGPFADHALELGFRSCAAVPMRDGDGPPFGVLVVLDRRHAALSGERLALLDQLAADLAAGRALLRASVRLRESEARYRSIVDQASAAIIVFDRHGTILEANPAACTMLGYGLEREGSADGAPVAHAADAVDGVNPAERPLIGRSLMDLVPQDQHQRLEADLAGASRGDMVPGEYPAIRADGSVLATEVTTSLLADGRIEVIARDVTARKALESERDRLAQAAEQASDAIYITDADGVIVYVNRAYERMNGYLREEVVGRGSSVHRAPEQVTLDEVISAALATQGVWAGEVVHRAKDGTRFRVSSRIVAMRDAAGQVTGQVAIARDISLEREQDARLAQAARLEAIAQLAGGVAHDLNNVLTMIVGHAALIDPPTSTPAEVSEGVRAITAAAGQAEMLTTRLLAFGRRAFLRPRRADLRDLLSDSQPLLARAVGPRIALVMSPGLEPKPVSLDPNLFEQALLALAVHARDAMPEGGTLRVGIERPAPDETLAGVDSAVLVVADSGPQAPPEVLAHLFEPFAAIGDDDSGLGLAMAHGFVDQSGGRIDVVSVPGGGTTFRVLLPLAVAGPEPVPAAAGAQPMRTGPATVLIAEDEGVLRQVASRTLAARGYTVLQAASGEEALELAAAHDGRIDLLFSDVVMPGLRGPGLAAALLRTRPDMRVLLTSGYAEDVVGRRGIASPGGFLAKPYTPSMLAAAVADLLDAGA